MDPEGGHYQRRHKTPMGSATHAMETDESTQDYHRIPDATQESHTRSIAKGLTWRVLATTTTTVIAYFVTGHVETALKIGVFEFLAKLLIYYAHERLWTRIRL